MAGGSTDEQPGTDSDIILFSTLTCLQVDAQSVRVRTHGKGMLSAFKHGHIKYR
jgi:hypothetical protein